MSGNRVAALIIVGIIHVAVLYALVTGLAYSSIKRAIERVTTVDVESPPPPSDTPPPPPPKDLPPPPPVVAPPPPISIAIAPPPIQTVTTPPPPAPIIPIARPAPPPPPPPSKARGATPKGQSGWASRIQENYPPRAVREEREGRVGVTVVIGPDGKVTSCSVSNSSGSSDLDEAACSGMQRYARFNPALDDAGEPTSGRYSTTIIYKLQNS
jgi:protein TonB